MTAKELISRAASEAIRASERARRSDAMAIGHVDNATGLVRSATTDMTSRQLSADDVPAVQRGLGALATAAGKLAASKVRGVPEPARRLMRAVTESQQAFKATNNVAGVAAPTPIVSSETLRAAAAPAIPKAASGATSHLLVLTPDMGTSYYFGLSAAAFDRLRRQTTYNVAVQDRLLRPEAVQAVSTGGETISLSGVVYTAVKSRGRELAKLRRIGGAMLPVQLTTGYGEVLGRWYMTSIEEEQEALLVDGAPRKQTFSLEFKRYGDDYQNV
jgi:uncharacterized protein